MHLQMVTDCFYWALLETFSERETFPWIKIIKFCLGNIWANCVQDNFNHVVAIISTPNEGKDTDKCTYYLFLADCVHSHDMLW